MNKINNVGVSAHALFVEQNKSLIDPDYMDLFRDLIHSRLGIFISRDKDYLLENKLSRILIVGQYKSIGDLYRKLKENSIDAMEDLVRFITTTHTFFFRENRHLPILANDIKLRNIAKPVIWVAATSTGEEVYSIIISLLEHQITDFFIVATDINIEVLKHCKIGIYSKDRLRELPDNLIEKYFIPVGTEGNKFKVKSYLKKFFILKKINLIDKIRFERKFDYIFCRNVLIYFDEQTQKKVLDTLISNLDNYGYLFVGHSESLSHLSNQLESVFSSVYNKKDPHA